MNIAHISSTFPPYEGGIGNVCFYQAEALSRRGHAVTVFVPWPRHGRYHGITPFKIQYIRPLLTVGNASFIPSLRKKLADFDMLHLHYPFFGGDIFVRNAARQYHIPYVVNYHVDIQGDSILRKAIFSTYNGLFRKHVMYDANKIIALTRNHINSSQILSLKNINEKIIIIPNGINLRDFVSTGRGVDMRKKFHIPSQIPIICFIGALDRAHYYKRLDLLMKVIPLTAAPTHLIVIGDGDMRQAYEDLAIQLGISKHITFIGRVANKEISQYLHQSDFLVLPSDNESFGIVLIEAFACGKPVVASNLPALQSVVEDGKDGLLFEKGNLGELVEKIDYLTLHPDRSLIMGKTGYEKVSRNNTWDLIAQQLENVYVSILSKRNVTI